MEGISQTSKTIFSVTPAFNPQSFNEKLKKKKVYAIENFK